MRQLDPAAVRWHLRNDSESPDSDTPDTLLVLLHGLGSHEGDLFALVPRLPQGLAVASLRAPLPWQVGQAWYELGFVPGEVEPRFDPQQVADSAHAIESWVEERASDYRRVILAGFSQGAGMALYVTAFSADRLGGRLAGVVSLSGLLPFEPADAPAPSRVPAFVAVGDYDEVIGPVRAKRVTDWATQHLDAEVHNYPIGHWVSPEELNDLHHFLAGLLAD